MKHYLGLGIILMLFTAPALLAQDADHAEVGVFADYFRFSDATPDQNFLGVGARAAFNLHPSIQVEAEMAYDFQRSYTQTWSNGISTESVDTHFRTLHGFFGPKFQTGSGPFRLFVTGKVGFDNFTVTNDGATPVSPAAWA